LATGVLTLVGLTALSALCTRAKATKESGVADPLSFPDGSVMEVEAPVLDRDEEIVNCFKKFQDCMETGGLQKMVMERYCYCKDPAILNNRNLDDRKLAICPKRNCPPGFITARHLHCECK